MPYVNRKSKVKSWKIEDATAHSGGADDRGGGFYSGNPER
jgi:hypothetical protein